MGGQIPETLATPAPRRRVWRPFILVALVIVLLFISFLGWLRFGLAISNGNIYDEIARPPLGIYLVITGFFWAASSLAAALGDWFRKRWALWLTGLGSILFTIWFWVERLVFSRISTVKTNSLFDAIFNAILLVFLLSTVIAVYPVPDKDPNQGGIHE